MAEIGTVARIVDESEGNDKVVNVEAVISDPDSIQGNQGTPSGIDSKPQAGDYAVGVQLPGSSQWAIIGYLDPKNQSLVENGEIRVYSRDGSGNEAIGFHFKNDGTVEMGASSDNLVSFFDLKTSIEQLKAQITQNLAAISTAIGSLGGLYTVIPLTATIDNAKIDELKVP